LRVDEVNPAPAVQLYPACAQIEVESEVTAGSPLPTGIKIPENMSNQTGVYCYHLIPMNVD
jgi:hypothetical protein